MNWLSNGDGPRDNDRVSGDLVYNAFMKAHPDVSAPTPPVTWRIHCASPPVRVFAALTTPEEHRRFWCERSTRTPEGYLLEFIDGTTSEVEILQRDDDGLFVVRYCGSRTEFRVEAAGGGTDVTLVATEIPAGDWLDVYAGWLNVLLPLKAWIDFGVDLRNHDPSRTWQQRFADQ